jgi:hypothetical protein
MSPRRLAAIRYQFFAVLIGRETGFCRSHYDVALWDDLQLLGGLAGEW